MSTERSPSSIADRVFVGGGEMGARMRAFDWASTPLGPVDTWPQSLRSAVSILLPSRAQIVLFWGDDLVTLLRRYAASWRRADRASNSAS